MIKKAFILLYPYKEFTYSSKLNYSGRFRDFNANIKLYRNNLTLNLSSKWKDIGEDIQIGLIQHLLMKMFKDNQETFYTDLYHNFIKNLSKYGSRQSEHPFLEQSFFRVNDKYFDNMMEMPNLRFGRPSTTQLGQYNFHDDTITISNIFENQPQLLDYIMYHELLHKKEKFSTKNGKNRYHTTKFRELEKRFEGYELIEKKLKNHIRQYKVSNKRKISFFNGKLFK